MTRIGAALSSVLLASVMAAPAARGAGAHVHGQAALDVAIDGPTITLRLTSPLDSLLGFERAPKTDTERARVREMAQRLRAGSDFVPTAAARCSLQQAELASEALPAELLGGAGGAPAAKSGDDHAELMASLVFRCAEPQALQAIDVTLFDVFKRLRRLDVQLAGPKGQAKLRLSPRQRQIRW